MDFDKSSKIAGKETKASLFRNEDNPQEILFVYVTKGQAWLIGYSTDGDAIVESAYMAKNVPYIFQKIDIKMVTFVPPWVLNQ